jgi:hypothetical protein
MLKVRTLHKRVLSLILSVLMVLMLFPAAVFAEELPIDKSLVLSSSGVLSYDGTDIAPSTPSTYLGNGSYTFADDTLTLNGVNFTTSAERALDLSAYDSPLTLNINGTNSFVSTRNGKSYGIYAKALTITGNGTLTATGGNPGIGGSDSCGIRATGDLEINSVTFIATGGEAGNSYGIYAQRDVSISGTAVVTVKGNRSGLVSYGIYSDNGDIDISGGRVTATGGELTGNDSLGISAYSGNVNISGGTIEATGGAAGDKSIGINANNNIVISGGTVKAMGGEATNYNSDGIYAGKDVTVSGTAVVTATGGTSSGNILLTSGSAGIYAFNNDVTISGTAKVTATGGTAVTESYGIKSYTGNVYISGGDKKLSGKTSAANIGSITPLIAMVDAANANGSAVVRYDNTEIDLTVIKYIKTYRSEADYLRDYPPAPEPTPEPEPEPTPEPSYSSPPPVYTYKPGDTVRYSSASGAVATVTVTEDGIVVTAGVNRTGSVNSEATAAAVSKAAEIARLNGETQITIAIPDGATGISKSTIQKLVKAAGGMKLVLALTSVTDGEEVGSIELPINSKTGQILTGLHFETENIQSAQDYIAKKWDTDILGSFETAGKGGWGDTATLTVSMDKLGFSAEDSTELYAIIYDTKANKWYQVPAVIENGNVVIETARTGVVTIVTKSVK